MRERIRNERCVELAFEGHHYYHDIRRWKIAPQTMTQPLMGMYIEKTAVSAEYPRGRRYIRRAIPSNRQANWKNAMYYLPFPAEEANKSKTSSTMNFGRPRPTMKNSYKYLMGTALLLFTATVYGAARHDGPDSSEAITTVEALRTDSIVKADRAMRIYQKLDMPYGRTTRQGGCDRQRHDLLRAGHRQIPDQRFPATRSRASSPDSPSANQAGIPGVTYAGGTARTVLYTRSFSPVYVVDGMPVYMTQLQLDPRR